MDNYLDFYDAYASRMPKPEDMALQDYSKMVNDAFVSQKPVPQATGDTAIFEEVLDKKLMPLKRDLYNMSSAYERVRKKARSSDSNTTRDSTKQKKFREAVLERDNNTDVFTGKACDDLEGAHLLNVGWVSPVYAREANNIDIYSVRNGITLKKKHHGLFDQDKWRIIPNEENGKLVFEIKVMDKKEEALKNMDGKRLHLDEKKRSDWPTKEIVDLRNSILAIKGAADVDKLSDNFDEDEDRVRLFLEEVGVEMKNIEISSKISDIGEGLEVAEIGSVC